MKWATCHFWAHIKCLHIISCHKIDCTVFHSLFQSIGDHDCLTEKVNSCICLKFTVHIMCNLYSILTFHGDLGAVCATLLEALPSIERVSYITLFPGLAGWFLLMLLISTSQTCIAFAAHATRALCTCMPSCHWWGDPTYTALHDPTLADRCWLTCSDSAQSVKQTVWLSNFK